jgi:hypothetical protein
MTKHERISPALTLPDKGQQPLLFGDYFAPPGPPGEWKRDEFGDPLWMTAFPFAQCGPWACIIPAPSLGSRLPSWQSPWRARLQKDGALSLPHLFPLVREQRGEETEALTARAVVRSTTPDAEGDAILRASRKRGNPGLRRTAREEIQYAAWLADGLGLGPAQIAHKLRLGGTNERSTRRTAQRYVLDGRKLLNDLGILPWTLWPDGMVAGDWWTSREFLFALNLWYGWIVTKAPGLRQCVQAFHRSADAARVLEGKPPRVADGDYERDPYERDLARRCRAIW